MSEQPRTEAGNPAAQPYVEGLERQERERRLTMLRLRQERLYENLSEAQELVTRTDEQIIELEREMAELLAAGQQ